MTRKKKMRKSCRKESTWNDFSFLLFFFSKTRGKSETRVKWKVYCLRAFRHIEGEARFCLVAKVRIVPSIKNFVGEEDWLMIIRIPYSMSYRFANNRRVEKRGNGLKPFFYKSEYFKRGLPKENINIEEIFTVLSRNLKDLRRRNGSREL